MDLIQAGLVEQAGDVRNAVLRARQFLGQADDAQDAALKDLHFVLRNLRGSDEDIGAVVEAAED